LNKQRWIDELEDEVKSLRAALGREQRKMQDGFFGSSTPSSKKSFKNSIEENGEKPKGARPGHKGHGRKGHEGTAARTEDVFLKSETCPECGQLLLKKGVEQRSVLDMPLAKLEKISFGGKPVSPTSIC
jgi:transposase